MLRVDVPGLQPHSVVLETFLRRCVQLTTDRMHVHDPVLQVLVHDIASWSESRVSIHHRMGWRDRLWSDFPAHLSRVAHVIAGALGNSERFEDYGLDEARIHAFFLLRGPWVDHLLELERGALMRDPVDCSGSATALNVFHSGDGRLSLLSHGSCIVLRPDDHIRIVLLQVVALLHLDVKRLIQARVRVPNDLIPVEKATLT